MSHAMTRAERLQEMERLYLLRSYSDIEMADRLGVDRTTVYRDRIELEGRIPIYQDGDGRYRIDRSAYISNLRLNLAEALSLYLAARRASQQTRLSHQHVASAIEKLSVALHQPMTERLVRAADAILAQRQDSTRATVFSAVATAWAETRRLKLDYRALRDGMTRTHRFEPYLLEPSPWSDGVYLIGYSDLAQRVITLKLDRIVKADLLGPFDLPVDFDEDALLRHAWGIWGGEDAPETVVLRFSPGLATRRLKESIWHPLERVTDLEDGGCRWEAPIAEWQEMLPWIRGWGADVEVLAPPKLREAIMREAAGMATTYQAGNQVFPYQALYAKTSCKDESFHLLLYHLIDVGQVALCLWSDALSESTRQWLAVALGTDSDGAGRFVAFLAALHDLGKAGPAYQRKYAGPVLKRGLTQAGFVLVHRSYSAATQQDVPHGTVSTWALTTLLTEMAGLPKKFARQLAVALGGHHGVWPAPGATDHLDDSHFPVWDQARRDLFWEARSVFQPPAVTAPTTTVELNALFTVISALTSVADWIGSREDAFPFVDRPMPTRQYAEIAARQAKDAVARLGWTGWQAGGEVKSFHDLFPEIKTVRPVQQASLDAASAIPLPALAILEAPTGVGKTETALALADGWTQRRHTRGVYVAMPTQATSNQMFDRVVDFLARRYPHNFVNVNLAHGQAQANETLLRLRFNTVGEDESSHVAAMSWFMEQSKRTLLAPFGVGTVDQALLSILQTKHFFVRLFGLHHKIVIFDEVHAYDAYMSTLFDHLLRWLHALGASVIILSATLPTATRRRLVNAYSGDASLAENTAYPQLTVAAEGEPPRSLTLPSPEGYPLDIAWLDGASVQDLVAYVREQMTADGCAAIICNTVRRAQELYAALLGAAIVPENDLTLFHARYPPAWRQGIEKRVLRQFGKPHSDESSARPVTAIVVATQVIEQSLDLDFDLLITEMAPIDLLIQRAGRLHRHDRGPRRHPRRLTILRPPLTGDGIPNFGVSGFVYEPYVLLQSFLALQDKAALQLPADTPALIEAVYGAGAPDHPDPVWRVALCDAYTAMQKEHNATENKARDYLIFPPDDKDFLRQRLKELEEDNPAVHDTFRARTRDIAPGVNLVGLFVTEQGLSLEPDGSAPVNLDEPPSPEAAAQLDRYVLNIQHWAALQHFVEQEPPTAWRRQPRLRHCRVVLFGGDGYRLTVASRVYVMRLSRELGLQIMEEEQ